MGVHPGRAACPGGARSGRPLDRPVGHGGRSKPGKMRETRLEETGDSPPGLWFPFRHALPRRLAEVAPSRPPLYRRIVPLSRGWPVACTGVWGGAAMCELRSTTAV